MDFTFSKQFIAWLLITIVIVRIMQFLFTINNKELQIGVEVKAKERAKSNKNSFSQRCPRFATMDFLNFVGLGNKVAEVVFGMVLAERTNATYLYDADSFYYKGRSHHGHYEWFLDFLPLQDVEVTFQDLKKWKEQEGIELQRIEGMWYEVVESSREISCHVEFHTYFHWCCPEGYDDDAPSCFCTSSPDFLLDGAFESVKWRLREVYHSLSNYTAPQQLSEYLPQQLYQNHTKNERIVTIIWHIRVGDLVLNNGKEYYERIFSQLHNAFEIANTEESNNVNKKRMIQPHIFFLGEGGKDVILPSFPFLPELCHKYLHSNDTCSYPIIDARESMYHMIHSDILITSGSSFTTLPALLRDTSNNNKITLDALPKEGKYAYNIYNVSESLSIDLAGNIERLELLERFWVNF